MIALPLMRKAQEDAPNGQLSESEAEELLKTCMKVLFYRDARSLNKVSGCHQCQLVKKERGLNLIHANQFQIAKIDKTGVRISDSMSVETEWMAFAGLRGYVSRHRYTAMQFDKMLSRLHTGSTNKVKQFFGWCDQIRSL